MKVVDSQRAATSRCSWMAAKWAGAASQPMTFSGDETAEVGYESASSVAEDYTMHTSAFNGKINWVQLDAGVDDNDHFISPEERLSVAMARQ